MFASFVAGAVAGAAIAIPVGAIAILIMETGIRRGFRVAAAAGAGAASADGLYAALAAVGGVAIAGLIGPIERPLRVVAVGVLLGIGLRGLARVVTPPRTGPTDAADAPTRFGPTYLRFLGLTLLNPATVVYFAALVVGMPGLGRGPAERGAFVAGAFLASLSWQTVLAGVAAAAHHRLAPRFQAAIGVLGNLVICGFAVALARSL